jgi:hydrogenase expression/formation protein HypE
VFGLNPLATIASGALLMTVAATDAHAICSALRAEGIACVEIGQVQAGSPGVWVAQAGQEVLFPRPQRDAIASVYEQN